MKMKNIAVFCSARENIAQVHHRHAEEIGRWIGENENTLVYGGIAAGLMEVTAQAVKNSGGKVFGVVPESRKDRQSMLLDEVVYTDSLHVRKKIMEERADAFVILGGGFGTLDELMSVWANMNFYGIENKKILIDNTTGLYNPLREQLALMVKENLLNEAVLAKLMFFDDFDKLIDTLNSL